MMKYGPPYFEFFEFLELLLREWAARFEARGILSPIFPLVKMYLEEHKPSKPYLGSTPVLGHMQRNDGNSVQSFNDNGILLSDKP